MEDTSDKQHAATGKRIAELRKKGVVMRSRDLSGGLVFIGMLCILFTFASQLTQTMQANFVGAFTGVRYILTDPQFLAHFIVKIIMSNFAIILPFFITAIVITILTPFLFGGWNFTLQAVMFNLEKLDPINNLSRIFSPKQTAIEIFRSMLKCLLILGSLIYFVIIKIHEISALSNNSVNVAIGSVYAILKQFLMLLAVVLIFIMIVDVIFQYFQFQKQSKMSSFELKEELKDTEGSVAVKRKIRAAQFSLFKQRLAVSVPHAHVIITNPTHYAVALRYDDRKDRAPKVVAKGKSYVAEQIRHLAIANGIPLYQAPPLARAIYHTTKLNAEIHPELYMSVAIILSYVHQLKNYQSGRGTPPQFVSDFKLPDEFIYQE